MMDERPEKDTVRDLWADRVEEFAAASEPDGERSPLYLGLCGAEGLDIIALAERGVVRRTETGAIAEEDHGKLVAVESDRDAALALKEKFNGLDVLDTRFENLLNMPSDLAWPDKKMRRVLRSKVVNLDMNCSLAARLEEGQLHFPVVKMVQKLGVLHAQAPPVDWSLCLTLHADLNFEPGVIDQIASFLAENFSNEPLYAEGSSELLGSDLYDLLSEGTCEDEAIAELGPEEIQSLLMALIPKRIVSDTHRQGWKVVTRRNLRYGAPPEAAPMVSWIIDFSWDPRGASAPATLYSESLRTVVAGAEEIDPEGQLLAITG
jgi:hypothetical protein